MSSPAPFDILVYGASGYTGRLVCAELSRAGASFAISGRDRGKLEALAATLGSARPAVFVAPLDDANALAAALGPARVVLDCAGPFSKYGKPVQDVALDTRTHFLDITGESTYMKDTYFRHGEAVTRGVALINAVGFDVVPPERAAALAAQAPQLAGACERIRIAFATRGGRPSQGTMRSMVALADVGGVCYENGRWASEKLGKDRWDVPFAELGTLSCLSIPWGDVITGPRSTGARHGRAYMAMPPSMARLMPVMNLGTPVMRLPLAKRLAERYIATLPEGPTDAERGHARFSVYAEATAPFGQFSESVWVTGGDPYDFTASAAALCARLAAAPSFKGTGALTPSQAFGAEQLLGDLAASGVRWGRVQATA
jgi:short subunit dehydrogenase-like uncharacterized protein